MIITGCKAAHQARREADGVAGNDSGGATGRAGLKEQGDTERKKSGHGAAGPGLISVFQEIAYLTPDRLPAEAPTGSGGVGYALAFFPRLLSFFPLLPTRCVPALSSITFVCAFSPSWRVSNCGFPLSGNLGCLHSLFSLSGRVEHLALYLTLTFTGASLYLLSQTLTLFLFLFIHHIVSQPN